MTAVLIRDARPQDASACAEIYAPFVRDTCVSFEAEPPDVAEMARRIADYQRGHAWLVAERDGAVIGYAYGSPHRAREAYRFATEVSVYLHPSAHGRGLARTLYDELFARLAERGYRTACAGITMPNERSERFHRRFGFETVGVYRNIGWKFDAWHDVLWVQRPIGNLTGPPSELR